MKKNMGNMDRLIRLVVAVALAALYFTGTVSGPLGLVLIVVAAVFLLTSFVAWCPGYLPFGLSTSKRQDASS